MTPSWTLKNVWLSLFLLAMTGCASLDLPPVTQIPTHQYLPGKVVWHDLLTPNLAQAKNFYRGLFGWEIREQGRYNLIIHHGRPVGGMVEVKPKDDNQTVARWIGSLSVDDVDQAAGITQMHGGAINEGPVDLARRGRGALVRDGEGAQLMLLRASGGDPQDSEIEINDWLWDELWTKDAKRSLEYYQALAGYDYQEARAGYWILIAEGKWRAGVRELFNESLETRWVPVIRVADPIRTAEQAEHLGGKVIIAPGEYANESQTALLADPSGALIMVEYWDGAVMQGGE